MSESVVRVVDEWARLRAELDEIERRQHPPITDRHGRVWTWKGPRGDIYVHDGVAAPEAYVYASGLPTAEALANPNYPGFCDICKGEA